MSKFAYQRFVLGYLWINCIVVSEHDIFRKVEARSQSTGGQLKTELLLLTLKFQDELLLFTIFSCEIFFLFLGTFFTGLLVFFKGLSCLPMYDTCYVSFLSNLYSVSCSISQKVFHIRIFRLQKLVWLNLKCLHSFLRVQDKLWVFSFKNLILTWRCFRSNCHFIESFVAVVITVSFRNFYYQDSNLGRTFRESQHVFISHISIPEDYNYV